MEQVSIQFTVEKMTWSDVVKHNEMIDKIVKILPRDAELECYMAIKS